jgi:hypothetical protein
LALLREVIGIKYLCIHTTPIHISIFYTLVAFFTCVRTGSQIADCNILKFCNFDAEGVGIIFEIKSSIADIEAIDRVSSFDLE